MKSRILPTLAAALLLALGACAPLAQFGRDLIDTPDGATLTYVYRDADVLPGLRFDPGDSPALGAVLIITGSSLALLTVPDGATCEATETSIDCRWPAITEPATVNLTGRGVLAYISWRRSDSPRVLHTFAR